MNYQFHSNNIWLFYFQTLQVRAFIFIDPCVHIEIAEKQPMSAFGSPSKETGKYDVSPKCYNLYNKHKKCFKGAD